MRSPRSSSAKLKGKTPRSSTLANLCENWCTKLRRFKILNVVLENPEERLSDEKLIAAQRSVALPEVQEMIRKLSEYHLGVFMPHIHDEGGGFQAAPNGVIAVEDDLTVSFANEEDLVGKQNDLIPVAWVWRDDGVFTGATCKQVCLDMPVYPPGGPRQHKRTHNQGY